MGRNRLVLRALAGQAGLDCRGNGQCDEGYGGGIDAVGTRGGVLGGGPCAPSKVSGWIVGLGAGCEGNVPATLRMALVWIEQLEGFGK